MSASINTNINNSYTPVLSSGSHQSTNSISQDELLKKKERHSSQENQDELFYNEKNFSLDSLNQLHDMISSFSLNAAPPERDHLGNFINASNKLNTRLQNLKDSSEAQTLPTDDIENWHQNALSLLSSSQQAKAIEANLQEHTELINKGIILIKNLHQQAQTKLPLTKDLSTHADELLTADDDETHINNNSNESVSQTSVAPSTDSGDFNLFIIMMSLVTCTNEIVLNSLGLVTRVNKNLQDLMNKMQDFLAVASAISKAYKEAMAEASKKKATDYSQIINWTDTIPDGDGHDVDFAQLLLDSNKDFNQDFKVIPSSGDKSAIQIGIWSSDPNVPNDTCQNSLMNDPRYCSYKDGTVYVDLNGLKRMLSDFGSEMSPFIGGNIASQNPDAFGISSNLDGLIKAIGDAQSNLQSQTGANVSKLNLIQQSLNQAISNFVTLLSNMFGVYRALTQ